MLSNQKTFFAFNRLRQCVVAVFSLFIFAFSASTAYANSETELFKKLQIFAIVTALVQEKFVEEPKSEEMVYGAIKGMLSTLDPHSSFMTPEEMNDFNEESKGSFTGVGIEVIMKDNALTVVSPIEGTPAYRAGIQAGDHIVKIDDKPTKNMSMTEAVKLIRGRKGTKVVFTISREKSKSILTYTVVRDVIPIRSVRFEMLEPGYAYLRISNFQSETYNETSKAIKELSRQNLKGFILDLRNNPGGFLDQSIDISGLFVGPELVVETKGRMSDQNVKYKAKNQMLLNGKLPMVVLVNEGSASASEIVAGALQDYKRALVVGATSFGKGSVQSVLPLPDGSGIRLTTARFYTPSGHPIQADGITPDVLVPSRIPPEFDIVREKDLEGHLVGENERRNAEKQKNEKQPEKKSSAPDEAMEMPKEPLYKLPLAERLKFDPQLEKALGLLKQNKVPNGFAKNSYMG